MAAAPDDGPGCVLLVDDRRENRLALRAVLEPLGLGIVEAGSGEEALREVLVQDFAVILLDVHMPGMDGFETAAVIKGRERSRETPIIFLTAAQADLQQALTGYEAGAVDFLLKPFDPLVLRSKVAVFADLDRQKRDLARSTALVRTAFDAAPAGMALCDLGGIVLQHNRALRELLGEAVADGVPVGGLLGPREGGRVEALLAAAERDQAGARTSWEGRVPGPEGVPIPVRCTASIVTDRHGEPVQMLLAVQDESDRQIAQTLQRALLPERLPDAPGLTVAATVSPGGHGTAVGGDWYDAIALPGGRLGVVVGDVAGRGIEAAARMGELRSVARAYALEGNDPVALVERMNGYHAALGADLMTTLLYAIVEVDTGTVRVANAGHPPPLICSDVQAGTTVALRGAGPPLGVMDTWRYEEAVAQVPAGGLALLYTDGLVERRSEALDEGLERLGRALVAEAGDAPSLEDLCRRLVGAMGADAQDDDVTCVVVRAEPVLGDVARLKLGPDRTSLVLTRRVLQRWLQEAGAEPDEAAQLLMAANEAWQNALEHGHNFARTLVDVELERRGEEVVLTVRDAGTRDRAPSDPDRGRGIELMRGLADEVQLDLAPHGSTVRLRRRLRAPTPRSAARPDGARARGGARASA
jgi:CheY-like chemotaxis protein/anti-sigma regulatory factor (Ser/Thr protein kinase)